MVTVEERTEYNLSFDDEDNVVLHFDIEVDSYVPLGANMEDYVELVADKFKWDTEDVYVDRVDINGDGVDGTGTIIGAYYPSGAE
jgi:hypothetical protein